MIVKKRARTGAGEMERPQRRTWTTPTVTHLRAGAAENTRGSTISDVPLEMIGS